MCKEAYKEIAKDLIVDMLIEAKNKGWGLEDLAEKIGGSSYTFKHYLYDEHLPSFPVVFGIHKTIKSEVFAKEIAKFAGGFFVKLPDVKGEISDVLQGASKLMIETGNTTKAISKAIEDQKITQEEKEMIIESAYKAIEASLMLIKVVEET